jgi:hypothetical protein
LFVSQSLLETLKLAEDPAFLETPLKRAREGEGEREEKQKKKKCTGRLGVG